MKSAEMPVGTVDVWIEEALRWMGKHKLYAFMDTTGSMVEPGMKKQFSFPRIQALTLSGKEKALPDASRGKIALIAVAFERAAQTMIDSWVAPFREALGGREDVEIYEVPMIDSPLWKLMRGMIDSGMRSGIPLSRHDFVLTYYGSATRYREILGMDDRSLAYVFLLDREGIIRWRGKGRATAKDLEQLLRTARTFIAAAG